ncbi:phosphopantetheine-binding protein [Kitasatospora purpeofusca]|uniref:phosphopantetheine-binding protein n=1 Tax=Kitasatospora purpeofusca TaxID=67352 RepID=UPI0022588E76|nr:phosphopantetheine-binding protein [Kitasatospora purpeofusca]MCX4756179.1 phosphopantetheine-binding protein [Kitasatospora purpeofusca]WSR35988.1 phosphopantetheine-binding protein [Kitasatospora purpeofusca]WSR44279.1 phosphopantetheine-binding protein [Kitasatospora purpeofusca]
MTGRQQLCRLVADKPETRDWSVMGGVVEKPVQVPAPASAPTPTAAPTAVVERALAAHSGVLEAAVAPSADGVGVLVVLDEMSTALEVREDLRASLLAAGLEVEPAVLSVVRLPAPPLGTFEELAAEVDEVAGAAGSGAAEVSRYEAPDAGPEADLAGRLAGFLGLPRVGALDDFVELGGDSLVAVAFLHAVQEAYAVPLGVVELFTAGTVRGIARLLAARPSAAPQVA